jgi:hypothetical protein
MSLNVIACLTVLWAARHCANVGLSPRTSVPRDRTKNHYNIIACLAIAPYLLVVAVTLWFA